MDERRKFNIAVIGGGPGGYVAAIRAAHSGKSVALIESEDVGGTCLNWGCIPTKTLLAGAEVLHKVRNASQFGITTGPISFDYSQMVSRKNNVVEKIRKSLESLIAAQKVTLIKGFGQYLSPQEIKITGKTNEIIEVENSIIATGSDARNIDAFPFDYKKIHNSSSILGITTLPKKIVIIGGGVIGCEFASLFAEFGVEVVVLEALQSLLPLEAKAVSTALTSAFTKKGIKVQAGVMVKGIEVTDSGIIVSLGDGTTIDGELALVAVGRKFNSAGIGLEKAGVATDARGAIIVNEKMQTNVAGVYAIGDVTGKVMLAHVASHQGIVAALNAIGEKSQMHYEAVPNVIFTHPEIGTVGYSLEQAQDKGYRAIVGKFPFQALGKSIASMETEGFAQIIVNQDTGGILGAQVVGYEASSLIAEMALAIQNELTIESIAETIHAHPTIAESWLEAALIAAGTPIHLPKVAKR